MFKKIVLESGNYKNNDFLKDALMLADDSDKLYQLYIHEYGDFITGSIPDVNKIFDYIYSVVKIYFRLAEKETDPVRAQARCEQYSDNDFVDALTALISYLQKINNQSDEFYQFKEETWYTTGIAPDHEISGKDLMVNLITIAKKLVSELSLSASNTNSQSRQMYFSASQSSINSGDTPPARTSVPAKAPSPEKLQ